MRTKYLSAVICVSAILLSGCSSKEQVNPMPNEQIDLSKEKTYKDMEKKIIEENREKWIEIGFERAKKSLEKYKDKINSYEVGKYALRKGYVTYPQIVAVEDGGQVSIQNFGCEIKKELNIEEIMTIFANDTLKTSTMPTLSGYGSFNNNGGDQVGVTSTNYATNNSTIENSNSFNDSYEKRFSNSYKNKEALDKYNVAYLKSGSELVAKFKNNNEYSSFCKMSNICN